MKVVYTDDALGDIAAILTWLATHYPMTAPVVAQRIESVVARISAWPFSARPVPDRPGVHAVPIGRYPYVIFYRVATNSIEILHVHHAARGRLDL